jgi:thioredoxin 1
VSESRSNGGVMLRVLEVSTMSSELIKHVSDSSFENDVIQSDKPVLVDFWAEWCGPCKGIAPILDEASKDYDGRLQIAKLNVDENRDVPAKFGIRGIPTLMLFKGGELAATKVGALSKAQLTALILSTDGGASGKSPALHSVESPPRPDLPLLGGSSVGRLVDSA